MQPQLFIERLKIELQKELPGERAQLIMSPPYRGNVFYDKNNIKLGAVMIVLVPRETSYQIVLMRRTKDGGVHSGQISLPGGKKEEHDYTFLFTALRETYEEVGLKDLQVLGKLTPLYIPPSNFLVHPYIAFAKNNEELVLSEKEVKEVLYVGLEELHNKSSKEVLKSDDHSIKQEVPIYQLKDNYIWGATAMILSELEAIIKDV